MGEKIKDLNSIKIGSSELMVELNEGYTKNEGRLIHVQNKHFRYLLKEKHFLQLASTILRAKCEMDYYKSTKIQKIQRAFIESHQVPRDEDRKVTYNICEEFEKRSIDYRMIEVGRKYVTIIVNNSFYEQFQEMVVADSSIKKCIHPYSEQLGYIYLYQMRAFELYLVQDTYVEIYFQLPCMSLTPQNWIPLDQAIQSRVWERQESADGIRHMDALSYCIYRICWSVFKKEAFSKYDIELLSRNIELLQADESRKLLEKVFFNYTENMLELMEKNAYTEIIPAYYAFNNY